MIDSITLHNFRSLAPKTRIELGRITALVGRNGSGKSNTVDGFQFLHDCVTLGLEGAITKRHGIGAVRRWTSGSPVNVEIAVELSLSRPVPGKARYRFTIGGSREDEYIVRTESADVACDGVLHAFRVEDGKWDGPSGLRPEVSPTSLVLPLVAGDSRFEPLVAALREMHVYSIVPSVLAEPQRFDPQRPMRRRGENWLSVLRDQPEESWRPYLVAGLRRLTGDIEDIEVKGVAGFLTARFKHVQRDRAKKRKWFDASQESDGTLRFAGIVSALLQEPLPGLVALEEPELTIHPGALPLLYEHIQEASDRAQVVVTTHSPDLLDRMGDASIYVVERREKETRISRLRNADVELVKQRLRTLGDLLRGDGLQGDLFDDVPPDLEEAPA